MVVVKFCNSKSKQGIKSLQRAMNYIDDENKTMENPRLVGGIARNAKDAYTRMNAIKQLWHKSGGRQYIHGVFAPKGKVEDYKMLYAADKIQSYYSNFTIFYSIHKNRPNTHLHFILNSVGNDGRKFNQSKSDLKKFKKYVDKFCEEYEIGFSESENIICFSNNVCDWEMHYNDISQEESIVRSYIPHITDGYFPICYRQGFDGNIYPISPVNTDGTVNMIQVINPDTDITPMIYLVDDDGNLTPGI